MPYTICIRPMTVTGIFLTSCWSFNYIFVYDRIQVYDNKQYAENINSAALPSNSLQGESISTDAQQPTQQKENYHQGNELAPQISSNNDSGLTNSMAVKNVPAFEIEESSQHPTSSTDTAESEYLEIYPTDMVISQERSLTSDVNIEAGLRFCVKKLSEERRLHGSGGFVFLFLFSSHCFFVRHLIYFM